MKQTEGKQEQRLNYKVYSQCRGGYTFAYRNLLKRKGVSIQRRKKTIRNGLRRWNSLQMEKGKENNEFGKRNCKKFH
jgi:hypothetical protein